jgi:hypothetical protein
MSAAVILRIHLRLCLGTGAVSEQSVPNVICTFDNFDKCGFFEEIGSQSVVRWVILSRDVTSKYFREYYRQLKKQ